MENKITTTTTRDAGWAKEIKKKIGTVVYAECDRFASPALDGDG